MDEMSVQLDDGTDSEASNNSINNSLFLKSTMCLYPAATSTLSEIYFT
jgi:hypothetical protein